MPTHPTPSPTVWNVATPKQSSQITNLEKVFNPGNYPFWAYKYAVEGQVHFRVAVDASGRPVGCEVIGTADGALGRPTCDLLMDQARFSPALDQGGKPIAGVYSRQVLWKLENRPSNPVADVSTRAIITVDAAGRPQCRMEASPGSHPDPRACQAYLTAPGIVRTVAKILFARAGERDRWELVFHEGSLVPGGPAGDGAEIGEGAGEKLIERTRFRLTVDAMGKIIGCTPIERGHASQAEWVESCASNLLGKYDAGEGVRNLVVVTASYIRDR